MPIPEAHLIPSRLQSNGGRRVCGIDGPDRFNGDACLEHLNADGAGKTCWRKALGSMVELGFFGIG